MTSAARIVLVLVLFAVLGADWIAPHPPAAQFREDPGAAPSRRYPLGTDSLGRDRFSRLLFGARVSLTLAPLAAILAVVLALAASLAAAITGGILERLLATAIDLCLSLPWLFLLLAARALLPLNAGPAASIAITFGLLGSLGWAGPSRIMLATAKGRLASDFVRAARAAGCSPARIALAHVLPHLIPVAAAQFWITAPAFLLSEANLGLLGLGVAEPAASLGNLLREMENLSAVAQRPWIAAPLAALVLVVACCHLARAPEEEAA